MAVPLLKKQIVKKRKTYFKRPQSDWKHCVKESWRRPKVIDSCVRRKFNGCALMPNIGYGSDKKTRHYLPNKFKKYFAMCVSYMLVFRNFIQDATFVFDLVLLNFIQNFTNLVILDDMKFYQFV